MNLKVKDGLYYIVTCMVCKRQNSGSIEFSRRGLCENKKYNVLDAIKTHHNKCIYEDCASFRLKKIKGFEIDNIIDLNLIKHKGQLTIEHLFVPGNGQNHGHVVFEHHDISHIYHFDADQIKNNKYKDAMIRYELHINIS